MTLLGEAMPIDDCLANNGVDRNGLFIWSFDLESHLKTYEAKNSQISYM